MADAMTPIGAIGSAVDRLVGGVMFHSEHADLCWYMGLDELARENEDGYMHDSKCLRKLHRLAIEHIGITLPEGTQSRSGLLDQYANESRWKVGLNTRKRALERILTDMVEWEEGTCAVLRESHKVLLEDGDATLAKEVRRIIMDTEDELAGYRSELARFQSVNWDLELAMWPR